MPAPLAPNTYKPLAPYPRWPLLSTVLCEVSTRDNLFGYSLVRFLFFFQELVASLTYSQFSRVTVIIVLLFSVISHFVFIVLPNFFLIKKMKTKHNTINSVNVTRAFYFSAITINFVPCLSLLRPLPCR